MTKVVITARVENSAKWEKKFRTHGALFQKSAVTACDFTSTDDNDVVVLMEVKDVGKFMDLLESEENKQAMAGDGVKRDTVKVSVLEKNFAL